MLKIIALAVALSAGATAAPDNVAGTWVITLESHQIGLGLEQDGQKLTGTLVVMGRQMAVDGELVDRAITISTIRSEGEPDGTSPTFKLVGTLKDDGTMEGEITTPHGTMRWTAERLKPPPGP